MKDMTESCIIKETATRHSTWSDFWKGVLVLAVMTFVCTVFSRGFKVGVSTALSIIVLSLICYPIYAFPVRSLKGGLVVIFLVGLTFLGITCFAPEDHILSAFTHSTEIFRFLSGPLFIVIVYWMAYGLSSVLRLRRFQAVYACAIAATTIVPAFQQAVVMAQQQEIAVVSQEEERAEMHTSMQLPFEIEQVANVAPSQEIVQVVDIPVEKQPEIPKISEQDSNEARRKIVSKGVVNGLVIMEVTQIVNNQWKEESEFLRDGETITVQLRHTVVTFTVEVDDRNNVSFTPRSSQI